MLFLFSSENPLPERRLLLLEKTQLILILILQRLIFFVFFSLNTVDRRENTSEKDSCHDRVDFFQSSLRSEGNILFFRDIEFFSSEHRENISIRGNSMSIVSDFSKNKMLFAFFLLHRWRIFTLGIHSFLEELREWIHEVFQIFTELNVVVCEDEK